MSDEQQALRGILRELCQIRDSVSANMARMREEIAKQHQLQARIEGEICKVRDRIYAATSSR